VNLNAIKSLDFNDPPSQLGVNLRHFAEFDAILKGFAKPTPESEFEEIKHDPHITEADCRKERAGRAPSSATTGTDQLGSTPDPAHLVAATDDITACGSHSWLRWSPHEGEWILTVSP
jgi:hypothetical protein